VTDNLSQLIYFRTGHSLIMNHIQGSNLNCSSLVHCQGVFHPERATEVKPNEMYTRELSSCK
jgi:hypothetical protein